MSKILFIMPGTPLAFNHSGAASRYVQNFLALKDLGMELHVLRFHIEGQSQKVLDFELASETAQTARQYAASWREVVVSANQPQSKRDIIRRLIFDSASYEFPFYRYLSDQLAPAISEIVPDLIWVEHSDAAAAVWYLSPSQPWIYSSHDMRYLIHEIRNQKKNLYQTILAQVSRKIEIKITRSADFVLTGSMTEADKLRDMGCKIASVIPMVNTNFPEANLSPSPFADVKVIHLGSLETTANRSGLITYLSSAHLKTLELCAENHASIQLVIVGDALRAKPPLSELLLQEKVVLTGYVPDLSSVLRPYDIAILPYTQDSGYRTKLPLLMGYAQVIVATRAAVAGSLLPGLEDVCILLNHVEEFPEKIAWLSTRPEERRRLGQAARAFAERHFSLDAVQSLYVDLLRQLV